MVGVTPIEYVTWWRLTCAARLLRDGTCEFTLAAVARQVGYRSESAFSTSFLHRFGVRPGEFRKRIPDIANPSDRI